MCLVKPQEPQREIRPEDRKTYIDSLPADRRSMATRMPTKTDVFKMSHPEQFPDIFTEWAPPAAAAAGPTAALVAPTGLQRRKPRSLLGLAGGSGDNSMADINTTAAKAVLGA